MNKSKNKKKLSDLDSTSIIVEEKKIIDCDEDVKDNILNKIEIIPDDQFKKKKNSLLKRTASEPKLIETVSTDDILSMKKEKDYDANTYGIHESSQMIIEIKNSKNLITTSSNLKKYEEINKINCDDFNSSYDEIFFYHFENLLIDFIDKKYSIK